jgi:hypothetical protein
MELWGINCLDTKRKKKIFQTTASIGWFSVSKNHTSASIGINDIQNYYPRFSINLKLYTKLLPMFYY